MIQSNVRERGSVISTESALLWRQQRIVKSRRQERAESATEGDLRVDSMFLAIKPSLESPIQQNRKREGYWYAGRADAD